MLLAVASPPDNDRGPRFMEKVLAATHQANHGREPIAFVMAVHQARAGLFLRASQTLGNVIRDFLRSKYPGTTIQILDDAALDPPPDFHSMWSTEPTLRPEIFPILRHSQFEDLLTHAYEDPIDALLQSVQLEGEALARVELIAKPASPQRCRRAKRAVWILDRPFFEHHPAIAEFYAEHVTRRWGFALAPLGLIARPGSRSKQTEISGSRAHDREGDLQAAFDKLGGHLFETQIRLVVSLASADERQARHALAMMAGALGSFTRSRLATFHVDRVRRGVSTRSRARPFLMSHEELSTLWHPPTSGVQGPHVHSAEVLELDAPAEVMRSIGDEQQPVALARCASSWQPFRLDVDALRRHIYVIGKTGMGKTTLLGQMIAHHIDAGHGVGLIDPHGDLAESIIRSVPPHRTNDVVLIDPSDEHTAVAYNPLHCSSPTRKDLVVDDVVCALDKIYDFASMPRAKDMLRNALFVLIEQEGTLLDLLRFLADEDIRRRMIQSTDDDLVRLYWEREVPSLDRSARSLTMAAILNKIRPFLLSPRMRAIVGQRRQSIDLRTVIDEGKILIINLSKGRIGEGNANLLGTLLVTGLQQAALSRANVAEEDRKDFHCLIDEFGEVTTPAVATLLSGGRKFRFNLVLSHQHLSQLPDPMRDAIFGNVGSIVAFQVGSDDAAVLANQLAKFPGQIQPRHLSNVPKYSAYARILIEGMPSAPFSIRTCSPTPPSEDRSGAVRAASDRRYGQSMAKVRAQWKHDFR